MPIQRLNPPGLLKFDGLTQVVVAKKVGSIVYIAGQSACKQNFELVGAGDYYAQSRQAQHNLRVAIEAAGGTVDSIVSSTVHLKNLAPEVVGCFMVALATAIDGQPFPSHAFSLIGVAALSGPDLLVEISAVAVLDGC